MDSILDLSSLSLNTPPVIVVYWELHWKWTSCFYFDDNLPLRAQVISAMNMEQQITLPADVRVCLCDETPFQLTLLEAETSLADIRARTGIHRTVTGHWVPPNGELSVHIFPTYCTDNTNSLFMRRYRNGYW